MRMSRNVRKCRDGGVTIVMMVHVAMRRKYCNGRVIGVPMRAECDRSRTDRLTSPSSSPTPKGQVEEMKRRMWRVHSSSRAGCWNTNWRPSFAPSSPATPSSRSPRASTAARHCTGCSARSARFAARFCGPNAARAHLLPSDRGSATCPQRVGASPLAQIVGGLLDGVHYRPGNLLASLSQNV